MKVFLYISAIFFMSVFILSCQKQIDVDLPTYEPELVVEGFIEQNSPPIVILTKSSGYFDPVDENYINEIFVHNAQVTINDGTNSYNLPELCSSNIPDSLKPMAAALLGVDVAALSAFNICIYTNLTDMNSWGQVGKTYSLDVISTDFEASAVTTIPELVPLDSAWFDIYPGTGDSLGFAMAMLSDPDTTNNAYRWFSKRTNHYTYGPEAGQQKDPNFLAPLGSAFDDKFFNGLQFEFGFDRPIANGSTKTDDNNDERSFFKVGDTIVVKFCTITKDAYDYFREMDTQTFNEGSPFASPYNLPSNINGGLGSWVGYGVTYDTIIATQ